MAQATTRYEMNRDVPDYMTSAAEAYINEGKPPGGFLMAVLTNDLVGAVGGADMQNRESIVAWTQWLYNDIPSRAWGSQEAVNEWIEQGGLEGE